MVDKSLGRKARNVYCIERTFFPRWPESHDVFHAGYRGNKVDGVEALSVGAHTSIRVDERPPCFMSEVGLNEEV